MAVQLFGSDDKLQQQERTCRHMYTVAATNPVAISNVNNTASQPSPAMAVTCRQDRPRKFSTLFAREGHLLAGLLATI
jgi:hypothetical protein